MPVLLSELLDRLHTEVGRRIRATRDRAHNVLRKAMYAEGRFAKRTNSEDGSATAQVAKAGAQDADDRALMPFLALFSELLGEHRSRLKEERERAKYAFEARYQAIGRIGLPAVREHRRKRLNAEHQARMAALDDAEASVPDLNAVMMLRVGGI